MRIIRRTFANLPGSILLLGRAGENNVTKLELDVSKEQSEYSNASFELVLKTPSSEDPYPVVVEVKDNKLTYLFSGSDLSESGYGQLEALVVGSEGELLKSATAKIKINSSIVPNTYPGPLQKVIDDLKEAIGELDSHGIKTVTELPDDPDDDEIVYLNAENSGFYRWDGTEWVQLTDDEVTNNASVLTKLSESGGKLLFGGEEIGGVTVVNTQSELDPDAQNGSVAVVLTESESGTIVYPSQEGSEAVVVDIAGESIEIGTPTFDETAIGAAITANDLPYAEAIIQGDHVDITIAPTVADASDNAYTTAGMTLEEDEIIVASGATKDYAIRLDVNSEFINPDKIVDVDSDHVRIPSTSILAFENLSGTVFGLESVTLTTGWNVALITVDKETQEDISAIEFANGVDINEYFVLPVPYDGDQMIIGGTSGVDLMKNIIVGREESKKGLYTKLGTWVHYDTFYNASVLKKFVENNGLLKYGGFTIPLIADDDVELLGLHEYTDLVIRDDVVTGETIQDVPVFLCTGVGDVCKLSDETVNVGDYIALSEVRQSDTGLPLRIIKTSFNGVYKVYCPFAYTDIVSRPAGWSDDNGDATDAPDFSGFTPDTITVGSTDYTSVDDLTDYARSALRSMSQCINVSADAMGTIVVPDDAIEQFAGTIKPNHKYYFAPGYDTTITLPSVGWSEGDAQFVMYLDCDDDYDFTFPSGTYFVGGEAPNTDTGAHKLIGCWLKDKSKWAVGGMDYEVPT